MKKTTKYDGSGEIIQGGWAIRYFGDVPSIAGKWGMFLMGFFLRFVNIVVIAFLFFGCLGEFSGVHFLAPELRTQPGQKP